MLTPITTVTSPLTDIMLSPRFSATTRLYDYVRAFVLICQDYLPIHIQNSHYMLYFSLWSNQHIVAT